MSQRLGPRGPVLVVAASRVAPQGIPGSARRAARDQRGGGVVGKKGTRVWRGVSGEMMMAARAVLSSCALSSLLLSVVSASRPSFRLPFVIFVCFFILFSLNQSRMGCRSVMCATTDVTVFPVVTGSITPVAWPFRSCPSYRGLALVASGGQMLSLSAAHTCTTAEGRHGPGGE